MAAVFHRRKSLLIALALLIVSLHAVAQSSVTPVANYVPEWQTAAGGHQEFDVASIHENKNQDGPSSINVPYGPDPAFIPTGGVFRTQNWPLWQLIVFGFKLTTAQREQMIASLPDWAKNATYDIDARSENVDLTKDQLRLMVQSLFAQRFQLKVHSEVREVPVYDVVVAKAGALGPGLRPHPAGDACSPVAARNEQSNYNGALTIEGGFPVRCGSLVRMQPSQPYLRKEGCRNLPMEQIVGTFTGMANLGRPTVDKTGLTGTYDWVMEFFDESFGRRPPADAEGMPFDEALRKETGLKLVGSKAALRFLVTDHIERPSEN